MEVTARVAVKYGEVHTMLAPVTCSGMYSVLTCNTNLGIVIRAGS